MPRLVLDEIQPAPRALDGVLDREGELVTGAQRRVDRDLQLVAGDAVREPFRGLPIVPSHDPLDDEIDGTEPELRDAVLDRARRRDADGVAQLRLDAVDLIVERVVRRDDRQPAERLAHRITSDKLEIAIDPPLRAGDELTFAVEYAVERPRRGLYFIEHEPRHLWSQSQDSDARFWFPCFDYPAEKQTTSATVIVPNGLFALANGALLERTEGPAETTFRYEQTVPHASYLVTLVVGPFSEIAQAHDRLPVFYYTLPGREADGERAFGSTPRMIDVFERTFGVPYPYARYSQIAVADFIFGGMENTAATTQTDRVLHDERAHLDYSAEYLASHELAHQWFGDLVTCRDWAHAWLNEGFATYCEAVWLEAEKGWDEYQHDIYGVVQRYLEEDTERYRRPIVCNVFRDPIELFDRHLYEKGAAVLHMLRGELGWERMRRSVRRYLNENARRNWCASTPTRGSSRRGARRSEPTRTSRSCAAIPRRPRAFAPRRRWRKKAAGRRARRWPTRWRTIRSGVRRPRSPRRSAARARPRRARRCSPTRHTRTPRCGAPSPTRSDTGVTKRSRTRCSRCAATARTSSSRRRCTRWARRARRARSTRSSTASRPRRGTRRSRPAQCAAWGCSPTLARCRCCTTRWRRRGTKRCGARR